MKIKWNQDGLIPAVVQDADTGQVLMVAYMNEESLRQTIETKKATYFSRSRQKLWVKGETSGHFQHVEQILVDCDEDTLLIKVKQEGAACHTGERSCFYRNLEGEKTDNQPKKIILDRIYDVVIDRQKNPKEGSYTNYLLDKGIDKILKKVGEESAETIIACKNNSKEEITYETADLLYHLTVMLVDRGLTYQDIFGELEKRFR